MFGAVVQADVELAALSAPVLVGLPDVHVLGADRVVGQLLPPAVSVSSTASLGANVSHVLTVALGQPAARTSRLVTGPNGLLRRNFTGTALPAFTTFVIGWWVLSIDVVKPTRRPVR